MVLEILYIFFIHGEIIFMHLVSNEFHTSTSSKSDIGNFMK